MKNTTEKGQVWYDENQIVKFAEYCQFGDMGWDILKKQLETAIRTTLVIDNKKSINLCVNKIINLINSHKPTVSELRKYNKVVKSKMQ